MTLDTPDYFLADLPAEAHLTSQVIQEACWTLKENREHYLVHRSTASLIGSVCDAASNWLNPEYPLRREALEKGPAQLGFSAATLARGIQEFFVQVTPANLELLLTQELGHPERLEGLVATDEERRSHRTAIARGPELMVHFAAGNVPNPAWMSLLLGVLVRSAQFVKCASGTALLPRLLAHSLYEVAPKIGACLEIAEWPGGSVPLEEPLLAEADCITATGSDETLALLRQRVSPRTRFLGYGHRVSFGFISSAVLSGPERHRVITGAARDVTAGDQLGCLSPHVFYVADDGRHRPELFAEELAKELARQDQVEPRGPVPPAVAAAITQRRAFYEIRAAHSSDTLLWSSPGSTAWTVVYEGDPRFQASCLHRFVYVKGVADLDDALHGADAMRRHISTVGLAVEASQRRELAFKLTRWGASRICPVGQMQNPSLAWRHDGRPALADLVTWTDCEGLA